MDQHSLDIAARITPLEVDTKVANALLGVVTVAALASELASRDASISELQVDTSSEVGLKIVAALGAVTTALDAALAGKADASALAALLSSVASAAGVPASKLRCDEGLGGDTQQGICYLGVYLQRRVQPAYATNAALSASKTTLQMPSTQFLRSSPPCSFPAAAELLRRRPGRASQLGSLFAEAVVRNLRLEAPLSAALANGDDTLAFWPTATPSQRRTRPLRLRCWPTAPSYKWTHCWSTTEQQRRRMGDDRRHLDCAAGLLHLDASGRRTGPDQDVFLQLDARQELLMSEADNVDRVTRAPGAGQLCRRTSKRRSRAHLHLPRHGLARCLEDFSVPPGGVQSSIWRSLHGAAVGGHAGPVQHANQGLGLRPGHAFYAFFCVLFSVPKTLFFRARVLCQNNPFFGSVFLPKILGREGGGKNFGMRSYSEVA